MFLASELPHHGGNWLDRLLTVMLHAPEKEKNMIEVQYMKYFLIKLLPVELQ